MACNTQKCNNCDSLRKIHFCVVYAERQNGLLNNDRFFLKKPPIPFKVAYMGMVSEPRYSIPRPRDSASIPIKRIVRSSLLSHSAKTIPLSNSNIGAIA